MFDFLSYRKITEADAQMLMQWRSSPHVSTHMLTQVAPNLDKQALWIRSCNERTDYDHRIFRIEGKDVGYCSITVTDPVQRIGELGVYVGDLSAPRSLSMYNFLGTANHALLTMGLHKLVNRVLETNARTVKLQTFNGYTQFVPGLKLESYSADSQRVVWFELTRKRWLAFRTKFHYSKDWDGNQTGLPTHSQGDPV